MKTNWFFYGFLSVLSDIIKYFNENKLERIFNSSDLIIFGANKVRRFWFPLLCVSTNLHKNNLGPMHIFFYE
jgi:hypothetical protein